MIRWKLICLTNNFSFLRRVVVGFTFSFLLFLSSSSIICKKIYPFVFRQILRSKNHLCVCVQMIDVRSHGRHTVISVPTQVFFFLLLLYSGGEKCFFIQFANLLLVTHLFPTTGSGRRSDMGSYIGSLLKNKKDHYFCFYSPLEMEYKVCQIFILDNK